MFELSYGKPAETVELETEQLDPFMVQQMTSPERQALLARLLDQHPQLAELIPLRLRGPDKSLRVREE